MEKKRNEGVGAKTGASPSTHSPIRSPTASSGLILICASLLFTQSYFESQALRVEIIKNREQFTMQTLTTTWNSGRVSRTITTTQKEGESAEAFVERHAVAEAAAFAKWPKD